MARWLMVMLFSLVIAGCAAIPSPAVPTSTTSSNEQPQLVGKEEALAIAQKQANVKGQVTWRTTFDPERELYTKMSGSRTYQVWVVEAIHPLGNKTLVFVDAQSGKVLSIGQVEAD